MRYSNKDSLKGVQDTITERLIILKEERAEIRSNLMRGPSEVEEKRLVIVNNQIKLNEDLLNSVNKTNIPR